MTEQRWPGKRGSNMTRKPAGHSPSSAHDEAYHRSPAHDAMQAALFKHLHRGIGTEVADFGARAWDGMLPYVCTAVLAECPLKADERIIGFADIVQVFESGTTLLFRKIYELKPKIETVGGLIRQTKVLADCAAKTWRHQSIVPPEVVVVVPHDDPALPDLRMMLDGYEIIAWNMGRGEPDK